MGTAAAYLKSSRELYLGSHATLTALSARAIAALRGLSPASLVVARRENFLPQPAFINQLL
jgi:hypothetical protein